MKIPLTFLGPFPMQAFSSALFPPESDNPGVYIWGFIQREQFIPYYVGKIHSRICDRICQHRKGIEADSSTYMRLTKEYMEGPQPYCTDPLFEVTFTTKQKLPGWIFGQIKHFNDRIVYLNNRLFLQQKYPAYTAIPGATDYPINGDFGVELYDYLREGLTQGRLHVVYAPSIPDENFLDTQKTYYESLETFVKFSLRGRVCSRSWSFDGYRKWRDLKGVEFEISNIATYADIFKSMPSTTFDGY